MHSHPGTYALVLVPDSKKAVKIGKLGLLQVRAGYYVYVGSAFGPGGLKARIAHHIKVAARPRWHIDFLRTIACIREIWYTHDCGHREHQWAQILASSKGVTVPFPGFGSSDCNCRSHLYFFKSRPAGESFSRRIGDRLQNHAKIFIEKFD